MIRAGWDDFVGIVRQDNQMLASNLRMAEVREVVNNRLTLVFGRRGEAGLAFIRKNSNSETIVSCLRRHFRAELRLNLEFDPNLVEPEESSESPQAEADRILAGSSRIQKLVNIVDGEIVGVRKAKD